MIGLETETRAEISRLPLTRRLAAQVATVAALIAIGLHSPDACAQDERARTSAEYADKALHLVKKGQFEEARKYYEKAYEIAPSSLLAFNCGLAEVSSGHDLDALKHFREYLSAPDAEPAKVEVIKSDLLPRAYRATGHIALEPPQANASLLLDKMIAIPVEGVLDTTPGAHDVLAVMDSKRWRAQVTATAGDRVVAHFEAEPSTAVSPPPSDVAYLRQTWSPDPVVVDRPAARTEDEPSRWNAKNVVGLSLVGVGAVGVLSMVGVLIDEYNADSTTGRILLGPSNCQNPPPAIAGQCATLNSAENRISRDNKIYPIGFVASGAFLVGGAVLILLPDPKPAKKSDQRSNLTVRPTFDPAGRSVGVVGSF